MAEIAFFDKIRDCCFKLELIQSRCSGYCFITNLPPMMVQSSTSAQIKGVVLWHESREAGSVKLPVLSSCAKIFNAPGQDMDVICSGVKIHNLPRPYAVIAQ